MTRRNFLKITLATGTLPGHAVVPVSLPVSVLGLLATVSGGELGSRHFCGCKEIPNKVKNVNELADELISVEVLPARPGLPRNLSKCLVQLVLGGEDVPPNVLLELSTR